MSKRRDYHRAYYAANAEKRRAQKLESIARLGGTVYRYQRELIAEDIRAKERCAMTDLCAHPGCHVEVTRGHALCHGHRRIARQIMRG